MGDTADNFFANCDKIFEKFSITMKQASDLTDKENDEVCEEDVEEEFSEEYKAINVELDKMFSALDALEQKNDNLFNQLKDLLAESREERKAKESSDDSQNQPQKN